MKQYQSITKIVNSFYSGRRLDVTLAHLLPDCSRSQIKRWILCEKIMVNKKVVLIPKKKVLNGDVIEIKYFIEKQNLNVPEDIYLNIVYEDNDVIVINKPNDLVVHPGVGHITGTIYNGLLYHYPSIVKVPRAGIIHRLDKNTTGVMLVAKTFFAYQELVKLLQLRLITREYEAIVFGLVCVDNGKIEYPIARHRKKRIVMAVDYTGKRAVTYYKIVNRYRFHSRIKLSLETGRTHQIRVHMAYINHPLIGDQLYGSSKTSLFFKDAGAIFNRTLRSFNRQALHSVRLCFKHPVTKKYMQFITPLARDMQDLISILEDDFDEHSSV